MSEPSTTSTTRSPRVERARRRIEQGFYDTEPVIDRTVELVEADVRRARERAHAGDDNRGMSRRRRPLSLPQLAERVDLPAKFLKQLADRGQIPHLRVGRRLRFDAPAVERALAELAAVSGVGPRAGGAAFPRLANA